MSGALPAASPPTAILEREFSRWAIIGFVHTDGSMVKTLRKAVGKLELIRQPYFNFTGTEPDYFDTVRAGVGPFCGKSLIISD